MSPVAREATRLLGELLGVVLFDDDPARRRVESSRSADRLLDLPSAGLDGAERASFWGRAFMNPFAPEGY